MRRPFQTLLRSRRCSSPQRLLTLHSLATHSSLFALCSLQESRIRSWFFNRLRTLFHSSQKSGTLSPFLSITSTLPCKSAGGIGPLKYAHQSASPRPATRSNGAPQHRPGKRTGSGRCSPFAAVSLFRHIVTSSLHPEKPYLAPHHLMAKRYRTHPCSVGVYSGFRVCFRCLGLKWSPGFQGSSYKP
jgi:hypothetical protein